MKYLIKKSIVPLFGFFAFFFFSAGELQARQYDPGQGRFISRDPVGYVDGMGGDSLGNASRLTYAKFGRVYSFNYGKYATEEVEWISAMEKLITEIGSELLNSGFLERDQFRLIENAMYVDNKTKRPYQYHDGMGLYGGYFAERFVTDPSGLCIPGQWKHFMLNHRVKCNMYWWCDKRTWKTCTGYWGVCKLVIGGSNKYVGAISTNCGPCV